MCGEVEICNVVVVVFMVVVVVGCCVWRAAVCGVRCCASYVVVGRACSVIVCSVVVCSVVACRAVVCRVVMCGDVRTSTCSPAHKYQTSPSRSRPQRRSR